MSIELKSVPSITFVSPHRSVEEEGDVSGDESFDWIRHVPAEHLKTAQKFK